MQERPFSKFNTPHDKCPGEGRDISNMPQHNENSLKQAYKHHQLKWIKKAIPIKSGTKQNCPNYMASIQILKSQLEQ